jgi:hypothetical protein
MGAIFILERRRSRVYESKPPIIIEDYRQKNSRWAATVARLKTPLIQVIQRCCARKRKPAQKKLANFSRRKKIT